MRFAHKVSKHLLLKRAGLQGLSFPGAAIAEESPAWPRGATFYALPEPDRMMPRTTWVEPDHGLAVRVPPLKQATTARGHIFNTDTVVYHESELEHRVSIVLKTYRGLAHLVSQYPKVQFKDNNGDTHTHTFDYFIQLECGTRIAIAVKYNRKREEMLQVLDQIAASGITGVGKNGQLTPGVADAVALVTETEATFDAFENAYFLLRSRDHHNDAECDAALSDAESLEARFRFGELLLNCWPRAKRRTAIWRLLDMGLLVPMDSGRIDELTWLRIHA